MPLMRSLQSRFRGGSHTLLLDRDLDRIGDEEEADAGTCRIGHHPWMRDESSLSVGLSGAEVEVLDPLTLEVEPENGKRLGGVVGDGEARWRVGVERSTACLGLTRCVRDGHLRDGGWSR